MSRPSIQAIGRPAAFWWPWQFQPGVSRKSPRRIGTGSPSTTVHTPSPSTTNRKAFWVCRCSGATSAGARYWIAAHSVGVAYGLPPGPGWRGRSPGARRPGPPAPGRRPGRPAAAGSASATHAGRAGSRVHRHQIADLGPQRVPLRLEVAVQLLGSASVLGWSGASTAVGAGRRGAGPATGRPLVRRGAGRCPRAAPSCRSCRPWWCQFVDDLEVLGQLEPRDAGGGHRLPDVLEGQAGAGLEHDVHAHPLAQRGVGHGDGGDLATWGSW